MKSPYFFTCAPLPCFEAFGESICSSYYFHVWLDCSTTAFIEKTDCPRDVVRPMRPPETERVNSFRATVIIVCVCAGCSDAIIELKKSGAPQRCLKLPDDLRGSSFSCFVLLPEVTLPRFPSRCGRSFLLTPPGGAQEQAWPQHGGPK